MATVTTKPNAVVEAWQSRRPDLGPKARAGIWVAVAVVLWMAPYFFDPLSGLVGYAIYALSYVIMGLGLNIVVGYAGLLDLGYVAFFAIGAFTAGWLASGFYAYANVHILVSGPINNLPGVHVNFIIVFVAAALVCALAGMVIGLPTLRLRGDYIAIVTLAFGEIIRVFAINGDSIHIFGKHYPLTGGRQGITPVDPIKLPGVAQFGQLDLRPWYWTILVLAALALFVSLRLRDSRLGRAWIAIREDEVAAASMGVPLVRTKLVAYALGASFAGVAGAFLASYLNTVNADQFQFAFSIFVLAVIIFGGLGSIWGVTLGALVLTYINNYLIPNTLNGLPGDLGLNFHLADLGYGIFGFLLVLVMILRPEGLLPERRRKLELVEGIGTDDAFEAGVR